MLKRMIIKFKLSNIFQVVIRDFTVVSAAVGTHSTLVPFSSDLVDIWLKLGRNRLTLFANAALV